SNNYVQFVIENGNIYYQKRVNGTQTTLGSLPYSASEHRFFGIRATATNVYWETSANGTSWTQRASDGAVINFQYVRVSLTGGSYQSETSPGSVVWDNVNGGTRTGVWCKASSMLDRFDDTTRGI